MWSCRKGDMGMYCRRSSLVSQTLSGKINSQRQTGLYFLYLFAFLYEKADTLQSSSTWFWLRLLLTKGRTLSMKSFGPLVAASFCVTASLSSWAQIHIGTDRIVSKFVACWRSCLLLNMNHFWTWMFYNIGFDGFWSSLE